MATGLAAHLSCPPAIAEILTARGLDTPAAADIFLDPHLDQLHSPLTLLGMPEAVSRILAAIQQQQPILIYGDYDVDGTTATVLLKTTLERIGLALGKPQQVTYHVPHRILEGYGMQNAVLGLAAGSGVRLVISVDTGIRAFAAADEARALGLDLIITDHHLPDEIGGIPDALAVINPNQPGCPYPNKHLCGAAVAFKLAHALLLAAAPQTPDPNIFHTRIASMLVPSFLKLVAIATVADSVPLTGENRALAALGLAALANPVQPGLRALMEVARLPLDRAPTASEVGFRIAPRINAAGRMDHASDVVELLLTRNPAQAHALAEKLDQLNTARRDSEAVALAAIDAHLLTLLTSDNSYPAECLIFDDPGWHRGVLGILASRVVDRTGRPALILTHADGNAHGSGRSIPGFHLLDALTSVHAAGPALFHRFGGHAHAVGFSLPSAHLAELRARMIAHTAEHLRPELLAPQVTYDAEIALADITPGLFAWLQRLAPYGQGNAEPTFFTSGATLAAPVRLIQEKHVCLQLARGPGLAPVSALGWSRRVTDWPSRCTALGLAQGSRVDLLYRVKENVSPSFAALELELCELRAASSSPSGMA